MRRLCLFLAAFAAFAVTSPMWSVSTVAAENCLTVDDTGVCSTSSDPVGGGTVGGGTVGGQSVGGGTQTVNTPPIAVTVPVEICYFLDCIPAGYSIPVWPATSTPVTVPGPVTVPTQQVPEVTIPTVPVPDGWELRVFGNRIPACTTRILTWYNESDGRLYVSVCDSLVTNLLFVEGEGGVCTGETLRWYSYQGSNGTTFYTCGYYETYRLNGVELPSNSVYTPVPEI